MDWARRLVGVLRRVWFLGSPLAVALTYVGSAQFGFVSDAQFLIHDNRYLFGKGRLWANLTHDYFWSSSGAFIAYWRPLTKASWLFEAQYFGEWAGGYHLVQVAWQLCGVAGVVALARRLGAGRLWASLAGLIYGLHPIVAEPTSLIMARSDVVAATACIWSILAWLGWRETGRAAWAALHVVALVLAFGSKETSIYLVPLLFTWAMLDRHWGHARRFLPITLIPVAVVAAVYLVCRRLVLGDTARPALVFDSLRVLVAGAHYLQALVPLSPTTGVRNLPLAEARSTGSLVLSSLTWFVALAALAWAAHKRNVVAFCLLLWIGVALAPVLLVDRIAVHDVDAKFALADRWLLPSLAAFATLVAVLMEGVRRPLPRLIITAVCALWIVAGLSIAPFAHAWYRDEPALLALEEERYLETAEAFRTLQDRCRHEDRTVVAALQRRAFDEALRQSARLSVECRSREESRFNLLSALVETGRMDDARSVVEELLSRPPESLHNVVPLAVLAGRVFLATGDPVRAEHMLREAQRLGYPGCDVTLLLARVAETSARAEDVAKRYEDTARCMIAGGAKVAPAVFLMAGYWWTRASRPDAARVMLAKVRVEELPSRERALADDLARRIARGVSTP